MLVFRARVSVTYGKPGGSDNISPVADFHYWNPTPSSPLLVLLLHLAFEFLRGVRVRRLSLALPPGFPLFSPRAPSIPEPVRIARSTPAAAFLSFSAKDGPSPRGIQRSSLLGVLAPAGSDAPPSFSSSPPLNTSHHSFLKIVRFAPLSFFTEISHTPSFFRRSPPAHTPLFEQESPRPPQDLWS